MVYLDRKLGVRRILDWRIMCVGDKFMGNYLVYVGWVGYNMRKFYVEKRKGLE